MVFSSFSRFSNMVKKSSSKHTALFTCWLQWLPWMLPVSTHSRWYWERKATYEALQATPRLNHLIVLSIYYEFLDEDDLNTTANEFVGSSEYRLSVFGMFSIWFGCLVLWWNIVVQKFSCFTGTVGNIPSSAFLQWCICSPTNFCLALSVKGNLKAIGAGKWASDADHQKGIFLSYIFVCYNRCIFFKNRMRLGWTYSPICLPSINTRIIPLTLSLFTLVSSRGKYLVGKNE